MLQLHFSFSFSNGLCENIVLVLVLAMAYVKTLF